MHRTARHGAPVSGAAEFRVTLTGGLFHDDERF
jgi:hypothetical protein